MAERKKLQQKMNLSFEIEEKKGENFEFDFKDLPDLIQGATEEELKQILIQLAALKARREPEQDFIYSSVDGDGTKKPKLNFKIGHKKKELLNKAANSLWQLEDLFVDEQKARNNSSYTISFYQRCFKKFYEAVAFMYEEGNENFIEDLYNNCPDYEPSPLAYAGKMFPIVILEDIDLQKNFTEYLIEVCEVNNQTVASYLRGLKAIIKYAAEKGWVEDRKIVISEKEPELKQCYTDEEIKRLTRKPSTTNFTEYRNWVIINHLLSTGNRIQTIRSIKLRDVDLDDKMLTVQTQKSGKVSRIPLPKKYIRILREYIAEWRCDENGDILEDEFLFPNEYGEQISDEGLKRAIARYNKSRGVTKTSIHLFRHTFAKEWIIANGDVASLQKILGHSTVKMAQHYANLYAEDIRPKVEEYAPINKAMKNTGRTLQKRKKG